MIVTRSLSIRSRLSLGIEAAGHDLPRAGDQRHPRPLRQAEGVEERQVVQDRVVRRDGHAQGAFLDIADQLVRPHHALGKPGRARRVHDEGRRGGIDRAGAGGQMIGGRRCRRRAGERGPVDGSRLGRVAEQDHARAAGDSADRRTAAPEAGKETASRDHGGIVDGPGTIVRDQETAVGLRQDVGEIARAEPRVDRHQHRADLLDGKGDEDPLVAVVEPQGDVLAGPDPGGDQAPRRLVDARRDLAKRVARRPEHQPLAVRQAGRDVVRQVAEAAMPIGLHGDQCTAATPATGTPEAPGRRAPSRRRASSSRPALR